MSPMTLEDRVATLEKQVLDLRTAREEDRKRQEQTAASLQAERELYLRSLYAWAQQQFTEEELQDYPEASGVDFVQFMNVKSPFLAPDQTL